MLSVNEESGGDGLPDRLAAMNPLPRRRVGHSLPFQQYPARRRWAVRNHLHLPAWPAPWLESVKATERESGMDQINL